MTIAFRGLTVPVVQWDEWKYDPSSGWNHDQELQGWDFFAMERLANERNYWGISSTLRYQAGKATLTTHDPTGNVIIDKWEMIVDEEQPNIFENPIFNTLISDSTVTDKVGVMNLLRNSLETSNPTNAVDEWTALGNNTNFTKALGAAFTGNTTSMATLKQYFYDYNRGVTNFIRGIYKLRHTSNCPARWGANIADYGVEQIYSIAQLLSEVQNPNSWNFPLPPYLAYKIANYYVPNFIGSNYMWGALKQKSNAVTAANNRIEIVTEYIIDQCNTNLYRTL